jgi:carboxymethylenebutenolidase
MTTTQWIDIEARDGGRYGAWLALPPALAAGGKNPGLVLFQEIFGVNAHIRAVAEQYALDGFVVLAPDIFWRRAPRVELGYEGADRERAMELMKSADAAQLDADVATTVAALRARPEVSGRVGAFGYCMGGRLAYVAAATAGVDAAACFYGGGIQNQLGLAEGIGCPVQFHYAGDDPNIPPEAVEKVKAAMSGKEAEFHLYPGAHHGFNCWARSAYDAPSAALSHGRALAFFASRLHGH